MVHGGFPGAALITQLFRQFTKPISERIVAYALTHPKFQRRLLVLPGRAYHRLKWNLEHVKNGNITSRIRKKPVFTPIKDEEAIEIGSQLMIEVVIFAILVLLMACDLIRSQLRAAEQESERQRGFEELVERKTAARSRLDAMERESEEMRQTLLQLEEEHAALLVRSSLDDGKIQ